MGKRLTICILVLFLAGFASCGDDTTTGDSDTVTTIEGLVAHYAFDEESGTAVADSSANNNPGTVTGATWVTGHSGNALSFDGVDDYVQIGDTPPAAISSLSVGTISVWFKFNQEVGDTGIFLPVFYIGPSPDNTNTQDGVIIEVGHEGIWNDSQEVFYTVTAEALRGGDDGSISPIFCFDSHASLTAGEWYHYVVVVDSDSNTGYINGTELIETTADQTEEYLSTEFARQYNFGGSSDSYFLDSVTAGILSIGYGRSAIDGEFYYFSGTVDDLRIYNRALTATEIQTLYIDG